jgi:hypothetical protein
VGESRLAWDKIFKHSCGYEIPAAIADIGTKEWLVIPGLVFISSKKG